MAWRNGSILKSSIHIKHQLLIDSIGFNVRRIRCERRVATRALADKCGVSTRYIIGLEHGDYNPTICTLVAIARALDSSLPELIK